MGYLLLCFEIDGPAMRIRLIAILLLGGLLLSASLPSAHAQSTTTWTVGPDEELTRITDALSEAEDGDRIVVRSGTYTESPIMITKQVHIIGEGDPIIDAQADNEALVIAADSVEVEGLTIENIAHSHIRDRAGIRVVDSRHVRVANNTLNNTFFGIYLAESRHITVENNTIRGEAERESRAANAIHMWNTDSTHVANNTVSGHRDGIYIEFAEGSTFENNTSTDNLRYGLHFMFSDHSSYEGNVFRRNGAGAAVMFSSHIVMRNNEFSHNWGPSIYGLLLKDMRDSVIEDNRFYRNTTGIYAEGSSRLEINGNHLERNGWGVRVLSNCYDMTFTRNNFVGNTFDVTTNSRRNPNTFTENYWSKYDGYDLEGDGYGDVPHRPVRLFALIVERQPVAMTMLGSLFVDLLDIAERVLPVLTPETLVDERPLMREVE